MPSEQDRISDGLNKPLLTMALVTLAIGFLLSITIALLPLGLVLMAVGGVWVTVLYYSASNRAKHVH